MTESPGKRLSLRETLFLLVAFLWIVTVLMTFDRSPPLSPPVVPYSHAR